MEKEKYLQKLKLYLEEGKRLHKEYGIFEKEIEETQNLINKIENEKTK